MVEKDDEQVNGKSILGMLTLAAAQGTKLKISVRGNDAEPAMAELEKLFQDKFYED
jgi:phosphocarrier protein